MSEKSTGTWTVKVGLAQMFKGGVIMDVTTAEQARIAEDAGESTTIGKLATTFELLEPLRSMANSGKPTWGTCAGMILLAKDSGLSPPTSLPPAARRTCRRPAGDAILC